MGLKFQRTDSLDKKFAEFAFLPSENDEKKAQEQAAIARFLTDEELEPKQTEKKEQ